MNRKRTTHKDSQPSGARVETKVPRPSGTKATRTHRPRREEVLASAGRRYVVEIAGIDTDGTAMSNIFGAGKPLRVEVGAVPGDRLEVEVEHEAREALYARVVRVIEPGPARVVPRCPIVGRCGGCPWQTIEYKTQLALKHARLTSAVHGVHALRGVPISPVVGVPEEYGYRTKLQMAVGGRAGALEIGFFRPHSHEVVHAADCVVQHPEANRILGEARAVLDKSRIAPYDERRRSGVLRYVLVRVDGSGARASLTLVVATDRFHRKSELGRSLAGIRGVDGVSLNIQPAESNVVLGRRTERLAGRERLLLEVAGMPFLVSPTAFFQTSAAGAEALVERVRARLPGPVGSLLDLYCGVGLFARALAGRAKRVVAVEENRSAIEDAEAGVRLAAQRALPRAAGEPPLARIEFAVSLAEAWIARCEERFDAVVVDPPRAGLEEHLLDVIATRLRPRRLVYVSCSAETLVRDLGRFAARGYATRAIDPVDMFPHTPHLECVALLEPSGGRS